MKLMERPIGSGKKGLWKKTRRHHIPSIGPTPSNKPVGHDLARHPLVRLYDIITGHDRFKYIMNQMGLSPSASCDCGAANQTAHHMASKCPLHRCNGDLVVPPDTAARNRLRACSVT